MTCLERTEEFWWTAGATAAAVIEEAMAKCVKKGVLGGGVQRKSDHCTFCFQWFSSSWRLPISLFRSRLMADM